MFRENINCAFVQNCKSANVQSCNAKKKKKHLTDC